MNTLLSYQFTRLLSWDIVILTIIYFVPTISHLLSFPLYLLDPMRVSVLGSLLFLRDKRNAFILAASLPLFSYFVGGHPVLLKSVLISMELIVNVRILIYLKDKIKNIFAVVMLSILSSKLMYYFVKYMLISIGLLNMEMLTTPLLIQVSVAIFISIIYATIYKDKKHGIIC